MSVLCYVSFRYLYFTTFAKRLINVDKHGIILQNTILLKIERTHEEALQLDRMSNKSAGDFNMGLWKPNKHPSRKHTYIILTPLNPTFMK